MKRVLFGVAAAAALTCGFAGTASAQVYIAVGGGWNHYQPARVTVDNGIAVGTPYSMTLSTTNDFVLTAAAGLRAGQTRFEGEYAHRTGEVPAFNSLGISRPGDGFITIDTATVNAYYDFGTSGFVPYVGLGVGAAQVRAEVIGIRPSAPAGGTVTILRDSHDTFALQAMAGFSMPVTSNMSFIGQFRYYDDGTARMHDTQGHATRIVLKGDSWEGGVRFNF